MPVFIHLANLIVDKAAVAERYAGGIEQFRTDHVIGEDNNNQEDNELFSIARMNEDEFDIGSLLGKGLRFDEEKQFSTDFTIWLRYGKASWKPDWIEGNTTYAWHVGAAEDQIDEALRRSTKTMMEDIVKMWEAGEDPFPTIG